MPPQKQRKSENKKIKEIDKSKAWRVRIGKPKKKKRGSFAKGVISQGVKGGVRNGGGWNRQISGPEIDFQGLKFPVKPLFCWLEEESLRNFSS